MAGLPLAFASSARRIGRFPHFTLQNLYAETAPSNQEKGLALISRPGLTALTTAGTAPRGMFQQAGLFDGDCFVVSNTSLYRVTSAGTVTAIGGTISGSERVSMAGGLNSLGAAELRIANGDGLYLYDGSLLSSEVLDGTAGVSSIIYILGMWLCSRTDTQEMYFRFLDDTSWTALAFQSAEYTPDRIIGLIRFGDQVIAVGESSIEVFGLSGDAATPLAPYGAGLVSDIGGVSQATHVGLPGAAYVVSDTSQVLRLTPSPEVVSDPAVTEMVRTAAPNTLAAWGYVRDGYEHYVLNSNVGTFIYRRGPEATGWSTATSKGLDYWRPAFGVQFGNRVMVADGEPDSGQLWYLDSEVFSDDSDEITRTATGWLEIKEGRLEVYNLAVNCAVGFSPLSGQGSAPLLQVRAARDGHTFGAWRQTDLGAYGDLDVRVRLNRWGQFKSPGALFQIRCSEPVEFRITDARINVPS